MTTHYKAYKVIDILSLSALYTFSRRTFPADYRFEGESHDFTEIVCIIGGRAGITADKNVYLLTEGQVIVHAPNEFHKIWSDGEEADTIIFSFRAERFPALKTNVFQLSPEQSGELCDLAKAAERIFLFEGVNVTGIRAERETEASVFLKRLELFLLSVLAPENESAPQLGKQSAENYVRIVSVMERHLGEGMHVEGLAKLCNCSVSALEKTIHRYSGQGAMAHYNHLRMKRAAELLGEGMSVKEVSAALGFSNQNYFSLAFKKWSGISPSAYRK